MMVVVVVGGARRRQGKRTGFCQWEVEPRLPEHPPPRKLEPATRGSKWGWLVAIRVTFSSEGKKRVGGMDCEIL